MLQSTPHLIVVYASGYAKLQKCFNLPNLPEAPDTQPSENKITAPLLERYIRMKEHSMLLGTARQSQSEVNCIAW
ncbi:hypothetical protein ACRQ5I_11540 [Pseudoramibacter alactolyticus]|uniref:hypothetical protein n=1 Tax=Pseudoramibacter alactolyticus TaxID=113287 RepID=UPI00030C23C0|nr:hypothetical protein [Pseudoramibacter alactolyticus]